MITQGVVKELLDYNPESGIFRWKRSPTTNVAAGAEAGCLTVKGYNQIRIDGKSYFAHRLAILYTDGYWPENTIDHVNRIKTDNRRANLREASMQCQTRNCGMNRRNKSGVKGVTWNKKECKWYVGITVGKRRHLGTFDSLLEAACHRYAAEQCLGFPDCDINSSAKQYVESCGMNA